MVNEKVRMLGRYVVLGVGTVAATPLVAGLLNKFLGAVPTFGEFLGLTFPHGYVAAGISAGLVEALLVEKLLKLKK